MRFSAAQRAASKLKAHTRSSSCSNRLSCTHVISRTSPASPFSAPDDQGTPPSHICRSAALASTSGRPPESNTTVRAAYIHLPFCKRKCFYCDFPVEAVGRDTTAPKVEARMRSYVDVLLSEIAATRVLGGGPLTSVFFGGGTPSLLPPTLLAELLAALDTRFGMAADAEVSLEADPGTFDAARLRQYCALGVTRLSVGVQAFQQDLLTSCGRGHDLADVYAAVEAVSGAVLHSWSLDLISGLPGLTPDAWEDSLRRAIAAAPDHVSVYDLQVEEGTPFERWRAAGRLSLPPDSAAVTMYESASSMLRQAGYEHYEVSNYARPGHRCAHNQVYWKGLPYYGFGLGAASYLEGRRFSRPRRMREWMEWVGGLTAGGEVMPGGHLPPESQEELLLDTLMLRLRTSDGVDLTRLAARFGAPVVETVVQALARHEGRGTVVALDGAGGDLRLAQAAERAVAGDVGEVRVRLTDPEGFLLSNDIISDVFAAFDFS